MYPRLIPRKNKDGSIRNYVYLVKSVRVGKKVLQKTVGNLGRLEDLLEGDEMRNVIEKLAGLHPKLKETLLIGDTDKDVSRRAAKQYGPMVIFRHIWNELGLSKILDHFFSSTQTRFSITESVFAMVCNRLMDPGSKMKTERWMQTVYEPKWEQLELHHLYRGMDYLVEHKEDFEIELYEQTKTLFNLEVDFVLFDTTSIMSWGEGEHSEILKHGHSKEKRGDLKQIMVGVLMTKEGIPIGHEVWEGNQSDKTSFASVIQKVKAKFKLGRVIFVGDRGMISQKNILALEEAGLEYILGLPMRKLDATKRELLLGFAKEDLDRLTSTETSDVPGFELVKATQEGRLYAKEVTLEDDKTGLKQRYIVCYNPNEARIQAQKREYFKEILKKKAEYSTVKDWIVKNGYKKYITLESKDGSEIIVKVDEDKLKKEVIYDGKWVLTTNTTADKLDGRQIAKAYKSLSQVEQAFRELKSTIEIDPMYHWTTKRIRAHVFICFLALMLEITIQKKLKKQLPNLSFSQCLDALKTLDISPMTIGKKSVWLVADMSENLADIFNALGCKHPKRIL
jgi:transposase